MTDPAGLRARYDRGRLDEADVAASWLDQLLGWFAQATDDPAVLEPNAIALATVSAAGRPSVRTVLAKAIDARGVVFYTNHGSAKGVDLAANPYAAAVFVWLAHQRQVRLSGRVEQVGRAETDAYFASRPRESQLGAWASPQSTVVASRGELDARLAEVEARYADRPVPTPPHWGGYLLIPDEVEFWQGRIGRMHDRIRFRAPTSASGEPGGWTRERVAP